MLRWRRRRARARPTLDAVFLDRLESHLGRAALRELLADGLIEIEDRVEALATAAIDGDRDAAMALAHDLTGTAGHAGLSALSGAAADLQRRLIEEDAAVDESLADPVTGLWPAARAALEARIAGQSGHEGPAPTR